MKKKSIPNPHHDLIVLILTSPWSYIQWYDDQLLGSGSNRPTLGSLPTATTSPLSSVSSQVAILITNVGINIIVILFMMPIWCHCWCQWCWHNPTAPDDHEDEADLCLQFLTWEVAAAAASQPGSGSGWVFITGSWDYCRWFFLGSGLGGVELVVDDLSQSWWRLLCSKMP